LAVDVAVFLTHQDGYASLRLEGVASFMQRVAVRILPFLEGFSRPRMFGLRLPHKLSARGLAGLIAVGTLSAIGAYALMPSDAGKDRAAQTAAAASGGETTVSKFAWSKLAHANLARSQLVAGSPQAGAEAAAAMLIPEPTSASRLLAMALATVPSVAAPRSAEPNLEGLNEIPRELIWNRSPKPKKDDAEPKAFGVLSKASEALPWDAVEPVPFSPLVRKPASMAAKRTAALGPPLDLPNGGQVETWMRAKATEIKGAERARPLYHFEVWLEPPAAVKRRLVGVSYDFNTSAVRPQSQASSDQASGFRISAGGLACADEITVTLTFDDGQSQTVAVDGCKLLSS
jgi:hypothetical protein